MKSNPFQPGTQSAYIPLHAGGDLQHRDVEFGVRDFGIEGNEGRENG